MIKENGRKQTNDILRLCKKNISRKVIINHEKIAT